jgi:SAM-dependent methyltransferase
MRRLAAPGFDFEVDARFVDMLSPRKARILDLGCGIGSAVGALRRRGHLAYGIDPTESVLAVALELFDPSWFRAMGAEGVSAATLNKQGLPVSYDLILMSGNVPAFLEDRGLRETFRRLPSLLNPGGGFVVGTTTNARGGPGDQDLAAAGSGLTLTHRYADWHVGPFSQESPWSVSVYSNVGSRCEANGPDGMFVLGS